MEAMRVWWSSLSAPRRRLMAVLAAVVLLGAGTVGFAATRGVDVPTAAQDRPGPVLLVPGYGGDPRHARRAGRPSCGPRARGRRCSTLPGDGTGDLSAQVRVLRQAVDDAVAAGAPSVDVVGYSAGGVVARLWVAGDDGASTARRVVTLGAPLHGTRIAAVGGGVGAGRVPGGVPASSRRAARC